MKRHTTRKRNRKLLIDALALIPCQMYCGPVAEEICGYTLSSECNECIVSGGHINPTNGKRFSNKAVKLQNERIKCFRRELLPLGHNEGEKCNRDGCNGILRIPRVRNCTCFISPPCSACISCVPTCQKCGWENR